MIETHDNESTAGWFHSQENSLRPGGRPPARLARPPRHPVPRRSGECREPVLHDALARRAFEFIDHDDVARVLVGGEPLGEPFRQLLRRERRPYPTLDEQLDVLLADFRRDADHGAVRDRRMLRYDLLDLERR